MTLGADDVAALAGTEGHPSDDIAWGSTSWIFVVLPSTSNQSVRIAKSMHDTAGHSNGERFVAWAVGIICKRNRS